MALVVLHHWGGDVVLVRRGVGADTFERGEGLVAELGAEAWGDCVIRVKRAALVPDPPAVHVAAFVVAPQTQALVQGIAGDLHLQFVQGLCPAAIGPPQAGRGDLDDLLQQIQSGLQSHRTPEMLAVYGHFEFGLVPERGPHLAAHLELAQSGGVLLLGVPVLDAARIGGGQVQVAIYAGHHAVQAGGDEHRDFHGFT